MGYSRINPVPTLQFAEEEVVTPDVSIGAGTWANLKANIPQKAGYKPISIRFISPDSPASLVLIYFYLTDTYAEFRFRNMTNAARNDHVTFRVLYVKLA